MLNLVSWHPLLYAIAIWQIHYISLCLCVYEGERGLFNLQCDATIS